MNHKQRQIKALNAELYGGYVQLTAYNVKFYSITQAGVTFLLLLLLIVFCRSLFDRQIHLGDDFISLRFVPNHVVSLSVVFALLFKSS